MLLEAKAINVESEIELLEYELKIALLNDRFQDAEDIKSDIIELENELISSASWNLSFSKAIFNSYSNNSISLSILIALASNNI